MKYDEVLEPVYQRSYLLSLPVEFKTLISLNYTVIFLIAMIINSNRKIFVIQ